MIRLTLTRDALTAMAIALALLISSDRALAHHHPYRTARHGPVLHRLATVYVTGYTDRGLTATGTHTRPGECAVDPSTIPLGAWVRLPLAPHGVVCHAEDTGFLVVGSHVDLWVPTVGQAYAITGIYRGAVWWR